MVTTNEKLEVKESSTPRDSSMGSKEGSSQVELLRSEALQGGVAHATAGCAKRLNWWVATKVVTYGTDV
jgi:hypothetical protein